MTGNPFDGKVLRYVLPMMRGRAVWELQRRLIALNHLSADQLDGLFGPITRGALRRFQRFSGLRPSGRLDRDSARRLLVPAIAAGSVSSEPAPKVWDGPLPAALPKRVILHWTAGGARASELERAHYHFLVEQDGTIVAGVHGIDANDRPRPGRYAAHTKNLNTGSIGVALCGMAGARERPFRAGSTPFREDQLQVLTRLVAQLCRHYGIQVSRTTVLGHGEVQDILGVAQLQKWDPMVLPWNPELSFRQVGDRIRAMVAAELEHAEEPADDVVPDSGGVDLEVAGVAIPQGGVDHDCATWTRVGQLCTTLGWNMGTLPGENAVTDGVAIQAENQAFFLPVTAFRTAGGGARELFVRLDDLAEELNLAPEVLDGGVRVRLAGAVGGLVDAADGRRVRHVTVRRGDTLRRIAQRCLGDPELWDRLTDTAGQTFDADRARRIRPGDTIVVPADLLDRVAEPPAPEVVEGRAAVFGEAAEAAALRLNREAAREAGERIAEACLAHGVTDLSHIAYIFATAQHETNFGRLMVEKWTNSSAQRRYETNASNSKPGDGKRFLGRGYVQLTFRENYRKFARALDLDLEENPDLAARPDVAARILVLGMDRVGYRHPSQVLKRYGFDGDFDFINARGIVNADVNTHSQRYGTTRGRGIGRQAEDFRRAFAEAGL